MEPAKTKSQLKRNIKKIIDIDDISVDGNDDVKRIYKDVKLGKKFKVKAPTTRASKQKPPRKSIVSSKLSQELNMDLHLNRGVSIYLFLFLRATNISVFM